MLSVILRSLYVERTYIMATKKNNSSKTSSGTSLQVERTNYRAKLNGESVIMAKISHKDGSGESFRLIYEGDLSKGFKYVSKAKGCTLPDIIKKWELKRCLEDKDLELRARDLANFDGSVTLMGKPENGEWEAIDKSKWTLTTFRGYDQFRIVTKLYHEYLDDQCSFASNQDSDFDSYSVIKAVNRFYAKFNEHFPGGGLPDSIKELLSTLTKKCS